MLVLVVVIMVEMVVVKIFLILVMKSEEQCRTRKSPFCNIPKWFSLQSGVVVPTQAVPGGGGGGYGTPSKGHLVDVVVAGAVQISQGEVGAGCCGNGS